MTKTRFILAATAALLTGTAAMATNVHVRILGNGNIACLTAEGRGVYLSASVRGNHNRLCAYALYHAGIVNDVRGNFNDVDTVAVAGAITGAVVRADGVTLVGTARGAGASVLTEIYRDNVTARYRIEGNSTLHLVVR